MENVGQAAEQRSSCGTRRFKGESETEGEGEMQRKSVKSECKD